MLKDELISRYGIVQWYTREAAVDHLFSFSDDDPAMWAESDGYEIGGGKPFIITIFMGEYGKVVTQLVIFKSYADKCRFVADEIILQDL